MKLDELRGLFVFPFPAAYEEPTTKYGIDSETFDVIRYHPNLDLALPKHLEPQYMKLPVICPGNATASRWWGPMDTYGTTYLDLINREEGWTWRLAHFWKGELKPLAFRFIMGRSAVPQGFPIGPAGDAGLSKSNNGCSPRHLHAGLLLDPKWKPAILEAWPDETEDIKPKTIETWPHLKKFIEAKGITAMTEHTATATDPWTGRPVIAVDWFNLLWPNGKPSDA